MISQNSQLELDSSTTQSKISTLRSLQFVTRTRIFIIFMMSLVQETVVANARFFGGDISAVPRMALTVGVATVLDAEEVMVLITGTHKAYALAKVVEEGVNHMFTVSAIQMHPKARA